MLQINLKELKLCILSSTVGLPKQELLPGNDLVLYRVVQF